MPLSLGNIILLKGKGGMRESIPRQVDKKSGIPKEEKGVWSPQGGERGLGFSRRRKGQTFFSLSPELMIAQQNNSSYSRIYFPLNSVPMTTMYPA